MWIFSTRGFYSVVEDKNDSTKIYVRARKRTDLENLRRDFGLNEKVMETPTFDYRYRLLLPKATWQSIGYRLIQDIDYTSFKTAANERGQEDKQWAMLEIWQILVAYQDEQVWGESPRRIEPEYNESHGWGNREGVD